jgi:hypothetical protein
MDWAAGGRVWSLAYLAGVACLEETRSAIEHCLAVSAWSQLDRGYVGAYQWALQPC